MKRWTSALVAVAVCGGCFVVNGKVRYDDLDQLVHRATGKHLHDRFTDEDFALLEDKAWGANLGDLVRITDEAKRLVERKMLPPGAEELTKRQRKQVRRNLEFALERVLLRVTDMRMMKAERDIATGGCRSSEVERTRDAPAC